MPVAVTFLYGKGDLKAEFNAAIDTTRQVRREGRHRPQADAEEAVGAVQEPVPRRQHRTTSTSRSRSSSTRRTT